MPRYAPGPMQSGGFTGFIGFVENFLKQKELQEQKRKQEAGLILGLLTQFGGNVEEGQISGIEQAYGNLPAGLIRSIFEPVYPTVAAFEEGEEEKPNIVRQIAEGKPPIGYRMPSQEEREVRKKEKMLAAEHPYKQELLDVQLESREAIAKAQQETMLAKIETVSKDVRAKLEANAQIQADADASREQKTQADNETRMSIANLNNQIELLKTILLTGSREKIEGGKATAKAGEAEDKKAMSEIDKRKSFNDDVTKQGFVDIKNKTWNVLDREQADRLKEIAENYGYGYSEKPVKTGILGMGAGGFTPVIDFKP